MSGTKVKNPPQRSDFRFSSDVDTTLEVVVSQTNLGPRNSEELQETMGAFNTTVSYSPTKSILNRKDFQIIDVISSSGASSQVYRGKYVGSDNLPKEVAIKRLNRREKPNTPGAMKLAQLALDETEKLQRMKDPSLPVTFGMYSTIDNDGLLTYNIVMEYVDGMTLSDTIGNGTSIETILDWGSQILSGLEYLHNSGEGRSVHRDIKPQNIRMGKDGLLKILDLGLLTDRVDKTFGTSFRTVAGTPKYVAPEQIEGRAIPASDVYSLGIALYELFVDEQLNKWSFGKTAENLDFMHFEKSVYDRTQSWAKARKISSLVQKMTKLDHKERYQSANLAKVDLEKVLNLNTRDDYEWVLPKNEAVSFAGRNLPYWYSFSNTGKTKEESLQNLQEYLEDPHLDSRDRRIIEQTIDHLNEGRDNDFISKNLNWYGQKFPERKVFGFKRIDLINLYSRVDNKLFYLVYDDIKDITNESFREFIKKSSELGLSEEKLKSILDQLYDSSRTKIEVDNKKLKKYLKSHQKQNIGDEELKSKIEFRSRIYEKSIDLTQDKYQALTQMLFEEEDLNEYGLILKGGFGKEAFDLYGLFDWEMNLMVAGGFAGFASILGFNIVNPDLVGYNFITLFPAIVSGGYLGFNAPKWTNEAVKALTPNKYYGEFEIKYSPDKVFSSLNRLLDVIPEDGFDSIVSKIKDVGEETDKQLKPYDLIDLVIEVYQNE